MEKIVDILMDYYVIIVFVAVLLILALIGYMIDSAKTKKLKKELGKEEEVPQYEIPTVKNDVGVKLGENVNNMTVNNNSVNPANQTVNVSNSEPSKTEEPPKLGTLK